MERHKQNESDNMLNTVANKPRVFLSHSTKDKEFVQKLHGDLRRCQIDSWLDTEQIRHGEPWQDAIFKDGIPSCDCILVYLTRNSVTSDWVNKELDAGLQGRLNDNRIGFLPYVSDDATREQLREDIKSLQVTVLNAKNYDSLLPRIVAEVWRSFLERSMNDVFKQREFSGLQQISPNAVDHDWLDDIRKSKDITIAKLKINFTDNPSYFLALEDVLQRDGSVTLIMADPRSPAMWLRYMEEPSGVAPKEHVTETAWKQGLEELAEILDRFDTWRRKLVKEGCPVHKLTIAVFPHYPTHAYYKFDSNLYVFHYPYRKRGFHGPLFLFADPTADVYRFLNDCLRGVINASESLEKVIIDIRREYKAGKLSDQEVAKFEIGMIPKYKKTE